MNKAIRETSKGRRDRFWAHGQCAPCALHRTSARRPFAQYMATARFTFIDHADRRITGTVYRCRL